jgi:hypothetical protein
VEGVKARRRPSWLIWLPRIWLAVAALFLLWQTLTYRGLSALAAEWQFNEIGSYHPALTFLVLLLILSAPLALLRLWPSARRQEVVEAPSRLSYAIGTTSRLLKTIFGAAIGAVIAALVVAAFVLFLPRADGPVHQVDAGGESTQLAGGPVALRGRVLYDKIAVFNEDFLLGHRASRFAPLVGEGTDQTNLRFFVELPLDAPATQPRSTTVRTGILRQGGLPGELITLYRYAGFRVEPGYYVLFASESSMWRPYLTTAAELLVLALFIALIGGIYAYRRKHLRKIQQSISG